MTCVARFAYADDPQADSITILPWTDASISIGSEDKRGAIEYAQLAYRGLGIHAKVSAPLDDDTHRAALLDKNKLPGGFQAALQIGWDSRADHLSRLEGNLRTLDKMSKALATLGPASGSELLARFNVQNGITGGTLSAAHARVCSNKGLTVDKCDDAAIFTAVCQDMGGGCTNIDTFKVAAPGFLTTNCSIGTSDARCANVAIELERVDSAAAANAFQVAVAKSMASGICPFADPGAKCDGQYIVDNAKALADKVSASIRTTSLERRDLLMLATTPKGWLDRAVQLDMSLSYDRSSAFSSEDIKLGESFEALNYDVQVGVDYTEYPADGLATNLRIGYEHAYNGPAAAFDYCKSLTSTDPMQSGSQCSSKLIRTGIRTINDSAYARLAFDYQFNTKLEDKFVPGLELRLNLENIGAGETFTARGTAFATPIKGNNAARIGVAFEVEHQFDDDPSTPRVAASAFLFFGATFSQLMAN
ncbi:MAG: hypothetical protein QM831_30195 [Kofleriaceae bacterium]